MVAQMFLKRVLQKDADQEVGVTQESIAKSSFLRKRTKKETSPK